MQHIKNKIAYSKFKVKPIKGKTTQQESANSIFIEGDK
jgi:hypothetical protein